MIRSETGENTLDDRLGRTTTTTPNSFVYDQGNDHRFSSPGTMSELIFPVLVFELLHRHQGANTKRIATQSLMELPESLLVTNVLSMSH